MAWNYLQKKNHLCIVEDCGFQFEHKEHVHLILMYNVAIVLIKTPNLTFGKVCGIVIFKCLVLYFIQINKVINISY